MAPGAPTKDCMVVAALFLPSRGSEHQPHPACHAKSRTEGTIRSLDRAMLFDKVDSQCIVVVEGEAECLVSTKPQPGDRSVSGLTSADRRSS
jgi:hypothetical protein